MIDKIARFQEQPCIWCNPITPTHRKCANCKNLYNKYEELKKELEDRLKNINPLPSDLSQIIRRARKNVPSSEIPIIRKVIKDKIKNVIEHKQYRSVCFTHKERTYINSFLELLETTF